MLAFLKFSIASQAISFLHLHHYEGNFRFGLHIEGFMTRNNFLRLKQWQLLLLILWLKSWKLTYFVVGLLNKYLFVGSLNQIRIVLTRLLEF